MDATSADEPKIKVPASLTLKPGEEALGAWICGIPNSPTSGVVKHEGHLVLTNERIVYEPMRSPRVLGSATSTMLGGVREGFELRDLRGVVAIEGRIPRLRLDIEGEEPIILIISGSRFSLPWAKAKWRALEDALERIGAVAEARRLPPPAGHSPSAP